MATKRTEKPSAALTAVMAAKKPKVSSDKLDALTKLATEADYIKGRIANGEELLSTLKSDLNEYRTKKLPDMMEKIGIPSITVEGKGNRPAFQAEVRSFYKANIESDWPPEKRADGFLALKEVGHDDLIKNYVSFSFPKGISERQINEFIKKVGTVRVKDKKGWLKIPAAEVEKGVHWGTLTSWLRDQMENHKFKPSLAWLERIGALVGKIVDIKDVSDGK